MSSPEIATSFTIEISNPESKSCCAPSPAANSSVKLIETICRIAIGVFAYVTVPNLFIVSLSVGAAAGAAYTFYEKRRGNDLNNARPGCAQGFVEYLSGTKFPDELIAVVTAIFIAEHVQHNPDFYVPFCGVWLGFAAGKNAINALGQSHSQSLHPTPLVMAR